MTSDLELRTLRKEAESTAHKYVASCAGTATITAPLPGTSVLLTGIEATMAYHVARVYGYSPTLEEAGTTMAGLMAASSGLKYVAIEAATYVPIVGWAIKPGLATGFSLAVSKVAIGHYEQKYKEDNR